MKKTQKQNTKKYKKFTADVSFTPEYIYIYRLLTLVLSLAAMVPEMASSAQLSRACSGFCAGFRLQQPVRLLLAETQEAFN